jgi:hypothetical protein
LIKSVSQTWATSVSKWRGGAVTVQDVSWFARLFRWCGMTLIAAGVLTVVATLLHPSHETATTIVASEPRLVAAHVAYTVAWLMALLSLPGLPVVIINGLAAVLFMIGYVLFGVAMIRTAALPRWSGVLVAVGAPAHLLGFGIAQLVTTAAWPIAILGSVSLGAGLAWPGYRLWPAPAASDVLLDKPTPV